MQQKSLIETTLTIADPDFISTHPELHHYTKYAGLKGIVESGTFWSTYFKELNDSTEVLLLKEPLKESFTAHCTEIIRVKQRERLSVRRAVEKSGGLQKASKDVAHDFIDKMYDFTFHDALAITYAEPFITSFCTHAGQSYEAENGLLSQWRGYGGGENYCIVFDTHEIAKLLKRESDAHFFIDIFIKPVIYAIDGMNVERSFPELMQRFDLFITQTIDNNGDFDTGQDGLVPFLRGATLYKHQGFREEQEVRIVTFPGTPQLRATARKEYPDHEFGSAKTISQANPTLHQRKHLALFEGFAHELPIKRIIVGPSLQQEENYKKAKALLGDRYIIVRSETPFIG